MAFLLLFLFICAANPIHAAAQHARILLGRVAPVVRVSRRPSMRVPSSTVQSRTRSALAASDLHLPMQMHEDKSSLYSPYQQDKSLSRRMPIVSAHTKMSSFAYQKAAKKSSEAQSSKAFNPESPSLLERYQDQKLFSYENFFSNPEDYILDEVVQEEGSKEAKEAKEDTMTVSLNRYVPEKYEDLNLVQQKQISKKSYQALIDQYNQLKDVTVNRIAYLNDGQLVQAFEVKATSLSKGQKADLVVDFRGGVNLDENLKEWGKIDLAYILSRLVPLAKNGYEVIASQYRGAEGNTNKDEFGGADIDDLPKLFDIMKERDDVNLDNIYFQIFSGGLPRAFQLLKKLKKERPGIYDAIRALAITGGVSEIESFVNERPRFIKTILQKARSDFNDRSQEIYEELSIARNPEIVRNKPVLLMSSEDDNIVPSNLTKIFEDALKDSKIEHKVKYFPGEDHQASAFNDEIQRLTEEWFRKHAK